MFITQNKRIVPRRNIALYNLQFNFQHTPVQLNGLYHWLLQGYCNKVVCNIHRYQNHQTIGNESWFSLFIGQQKR